MTHGAHAVAQCAAIVLAVFSAAGVASAGERFALIDAQTTESLRRQLLAASSDGYRVVASAQGAAINGKDRIVVLVERSAEAAGYAYAVVRTSADFDTPVDGKSVNAWAAEGYGFSREHLLARRIEDWWVPEASYDEQLTLLLERPPGAVSRRYTTLEVTSAAQVSRELGEAQAAGHKVLGMWNAGRALHVIVEEREAARPTVPDPVPDPEAYRLFIADRRMGFEGDLERMSKRGYRIVDVVDQSIHAPPMVLFHRDPQPEGGLDIQLVPNLEKKIYSGSLERKLNKHGKKGYRVAARSVTTSVVAFERWPGERRPVRYRAISSKQPPGLPQALEEAVDSGYRVLTLLTYADETVAVVER